MRRTTMKHQITLRYGDEIHEYLEEVKEPGEDTPSCVRRVIEAMMRRENSSKFVDEIVTKLRREIRDLKEGNGTTGTSDNGVVEHLSAFEGNLISTVSLLSKRLEALESSQVSTNETMREFIGKFNNFAEALSANQRAFLEGRKA